ncbi:MAG: hypothetical protein P8181_07445 [bacterium]
MKSKKPPALTSPWKIGFFVSLTLIVVGVGVTYFFVDRAGMTWDWQNKEEWLGVLHGQGFLADILPVIALIALSSLISFLIISGAVRKYRRYLDSGLDYKNLLVSLKDIDDIRDTSKIEKLRHQPELKRLLLTISQSINERFKTLDERERDLEKNAGSKIEAREDELLSAFTGECEELTQAIENPTEDGLSEELDISNPALRRVEYAVRRVMASPARDVRSEATPSDVGGSMSYNELRKASDVLYHRLEDIVDEMKQSGTTAKDIEKQLSNLSPAMETALAAGRSEKPARGCQGILGTLKSFEKLSASLGVLSEEAKGIAISTALSAGSGEGTQDELIRLAEEVKDISSRFKESSVQYVELTKELKETIHELDEGYGGTDDGADPAMLGQSLASIQAKVALWVERVVVLSDKVANFQRSYSLAVSSLPDVDADVALDADEPAPATGGTDEAEASTEFGFETLDRAESIFASSDGTESDAAVDGRPDAGMFSAMARDEEAPVGADDGDFAEDEGSEESSREDWADVGKAASGEDEGAEVADRGTDSLEPPQPVDEPADAGTDDLERPEAIEEPIDAGARDFELSEPVDEPVDRSTVRGRIEGFESFAAGETGPKRTPVEHGMTPLREPDERGVTPDDGEDGDSSRPEAVVEEPGKPDEAPAEEQDVIDLYDLGAVDYDPAVHG